MSNRRWLAQSPARIERVMRTLVSTYGVDSVQMHDMDFFISEARVAEFAERIADLGIRWWALGRIDTLMQYSETTWALMARSGLTMVFSGAESSSDAALAAMNKGGKASARSPSSSRRACAATASCPSTRSCSARRPIPKATWTERSSSSAQSSASTRRRRSCSTPTRRCRWTAALYAEASKMGFKFPTTLDEWSSEEWKQLMMRRGDGIPWIDGSIRRQVRNFERVLNAYYPTITDRRLTPARRLLLKAMSGWRYTLRMYAAPYELRALHRLIHYQRPETTGF